ncbi:hypothetical protein TNCV_3897171 [Trichonephila clavipes]|nr:hypothetical protein TNCV_3897171 [Trichonephila clavipes]
MACPKYSVVCHWFAIPGIVPSWHGGTINSRRAASPLVWLVEERWETPDHPQVSSLKIGVETNQIVLSPACCSKLRLATVVT